MVATNQYPQAQNLLNIALQMNPSDPAAYNELGKLQLYDLNQPSQAFANYRNAIAKGGQATLRVSIEHSNGWLTIAKGKAAFKDNSGAHSFPLSDVEEAKRNKANLVKIGKGRQEFHIFLANGGKFNIEPTSQDPADETEFILSVIGQQ
jgi:tetratricopeptide (TPR) repeat protein